MSKTLPEADELQSREDLAKLMSPEYIAGTQKHILEVFDRLAKAEARRDAEKKLYNSLRNTPPTAWSRETEFAEVLWLDHTTWEDYSLFDVPALAHDGFLHPGEWDKHAVRCPGTAFFYSEKTLPLSYSLRTFVSKKKQGSVFFDGPVTFPVLFEQHGEDKDFRQEVWMSTTPMEILTQRAGVEAATGRCVVGGLGLGWFLKEIAAKPEVTEIVVVEINEKLLGWLRPILEAKFPDVAAKVTSWIAADVYDYMRHNQDADSYLLDIWPAFGDADYDPYFVVLESTVFGGRLWGWGRGASYEGAPPSVDPSAKFSSPRSYMRKAPCSGCPFSRAGVYGPEQVDPLALIGQAHGPFVLPCHQEPGYEENKQGDVLAMAQCAGAAIFRSNVGIAEKFPKSIHILPADPDKVFATPAELLADAAGLPEHAAKTMLAIRTPHDLMCAELSKQQVRVYGTKKG